MKKLVKLLLCMTLVLALTGCGKEQSATYKLEQDMMGITITDTQVITAKGDKVTTMKEVTEISFGDLSEDDIAVAAETYDQTYGDLAATFPEGVDATYGLDGNVYKFELTMDLAGADIDKLIEAGLVTVPAGEEDKKIVYISFKQSCEALESMGYSVVE